MKYNAVCSLADELTAEYGTRDPIALCEAKGINILYQQMGTHKTAIKGFVIGVDGVFTITINSDLPENVQRVIIAHELCHALMHCKGRVTQMNDRSLLNDVSQKEREANLFAAQLLIDDNDIFEIPEGVTFFQLASSLDVPAELLDFKFIILNGKYPNSPQSPINSHNDFLRSIKIHNE